MENVPEISLVEKVQLLDGIRTQISIYKRYLGAVDLQKLQANPILKAEKETYEKVLF